MLSQASKSAVRCICRRSFSVTSRAPKFLPHEVLVSKLVSEKGLVHEKVVAKKKKLFDLRDHEPTQPNCYGSVNIKVEGHDIVTVEKFMQRIHKFVLKQKIKVREMYALPTEYLSVKHIGNQFTAALSDMHAEAELPVHTRIIQVSDLKSTVAPILIQTLVKDVPPGVQLSMHEYTEDDYLKRHKKNKELEQAEEEYRKLRFGK